jgi:hypothetical protein
VKYCEENSGQLVMVLIFEERLESGYQQESISACVIFFHDYYFTFGKMIQLVLAKIKAY